MMTSLMHSVSISRIVNNKPVLISKEAKNLTWDNYNSTNIQSIAREQGDEYVIVAVTYLLKEAVFFVGNNLTTNDLVMYAEMFMHQWKTWSIDDITMMLRKGINGEFGKSNKNFSYETLTDWAYQYEDKRLDYIDSAHQRKKENTDIHHRLSPKMDGPTPIIIPAHLKTAKEIDDHLNKVKK